MKNNKGFSLVQVMVAAGLMGGIALGVMQLSKQMQTTTVMGETSLEESQLFNHISTILIDANSCEETFKGLAFGDSVESIKRVKSDGNSVEVYTAGEIYGNRALELTDMILSGKEGEEHLTLVLKRIKSAYSGPKEIKKKVHLKLNFKDGKVISCFSELSNVTETSINKSCTAMGADYDPSTQTCKNIKLNGEEAQVCVAGNCKNIKTYVEDLIVEVSEKSTLCIIKYNPLMGFKDTKLDLKQNKCHASSTSGGAVSCTIDPGITSCN